MPEQWKMICRLKDMPLAGARMVQRGLAWQDLPGVALFRAADDTVYALLDTVPCLGGPLAQDGGDVSIRTLATILLQCL